ncbi:MAG: type II toxin-antitoxin system MqsA family antitoxin [Chloroflexi bacterium]|nr:type II toxin-antitoxin system MqsA family antitoxin [Ardenticatenaceae bacterium]MBL1131373.1 type II toxin-antitoxin system MqsA family antitoxin [Chloroflexota bacterium]NOG37477.1 type II toxin-antitoxin system MqsA family antitoxin [Chloroflexota bacterium]
MRCGICNYTPLELTTTTMEEWDGDELVVIEEVPVEKCPQCGEEYFKPEVLEELEALIERRRQLPQLQPEAILQVPVFKFALAV